MVDPKTLKIGERIYTIYEDWPHEGGDLTVDYVVVKCDDGDPAVLVRVYPNVDERGRVFAYVVGKDIFPAWMWRDEREAELKSIERAQQSINDDLALLQSRQQELMARKGVT